VRELKSGRNFGGQVAARGNLRSGRGGGIFPAIATCRSTLSSSPGLDHRTFFRALSSHLLELFTVKMVLQKMVIKRTVEKMMMERILLKKMME
jgi:hypothetical protein